MPEAGPETAVRPATHRDLDALAGLWRALVEHHAPLDPHYRFRPDGETELARLLAGALGDPEVALLVWEEAGALLGFLEVRLGQPPPVLVEGRRGELVDLFVREHARRRGIGRALVAAGLDWLRERGAGRVEVRVASGNREGQGFWRALGFGDFVDVLQRRL